MTYVFLVHHASYCCGLGRGVVSGIQPDLRVVPEIPAGPEVPEVRAEGQQHQLVSRESSCHLDKLVVADGAASPRHHGKYNIGTLPATRE